MLDLLPLSLSLSRTYSRGVRIVFSCNIRNALAPEHGQTLALYSKVNGYCTGLDGTKHAISNHIPLHSRYCFRQALALLTCLLYWTS